MASFSLEEDDYDGLFITQEAKDNSLEKREDVEEESDSYFGVDPFDFGSPSVSFMAARSTYQPQCSDVSDDDFVNYNGQNK